MTVKYDKVERLYSDKVVQFAPKYLGHWQAQQKEVFMAAIELILKGETKDGHDNLLGRVEKE